MDFPIVPVITREEFVQAFMRPRYRHLAQLRGRSILISEDYIFREVQNDAAVEDDIDDQSLSAK